MQLVNLSLKTSQKKRLASVAFILVFLNSCSSYNSTSELLALFSDYRVEQDSLKENITATLQVWENHSWSKDYCWNIFINYVLPPQIADEPIEYYWRTDIPKWMGLNYKGEGLLQFAQRINSRIEVDMRPEDWGNAQMGYSATISGRFGKCDDRAILTAMAMRSMGVPAAFDMIPMCGSGNNGHSFCSVMAPDSSLYVFQSSTDDGMAIHFGHKIPKIYRRLYFRKEVESQFQSDYIDGHTELFSDPRLIDVTHQHKIGQRDISIKPLRQIRNNVAYLSVFHPKGWFPIAQGIFGDGHMIFNNVGTGVDSEGKMPVRSENVGDGILYIPMSDGDIPVAHPFILSSDNIRYLIPSSVKKETVILKRKFPKSERVSSFAERMIDGVIEVSDRSDFSDAVQIYAIYDVPASHPQKIKPDRNIKGRYIRFRKPMGLLSIAELMAYDPSDTPLRGTPISCLDLQGEASVSNIHDEDPLTYFEISNGFNLWVGIDLGYSMSITSFGFCPRNDDNDISPGDIYELFYWDWEWKSLGTKKADTYELVYENVPENALLWLRNRSRGKEERPFTYENNRQIWW